MAVMECTGTSLPEQGKTKKTYYEWIRLIACFFVIFNHLKGYVLFMNASGVKQLFYMLLSVITKINVPLFLWFPVRCFWKNRRICANVIYLSNCLIKLKGGDKSREKIIDTCKIMR